MFDTALGASGPRRGAERKLAALPAALAIHAAALGLVTVGQLWAVGRVADPAITEAYVDVQLPSPPPAPPPPPVGDDGDDATEPPAATAEPHQINDAPSEPAKAGPQESAEAKGGVPGGVPGGKAGAVPGGVAEPQAPPPPPPPPPPKVYTLELVSAPPVAVSQRAPVYPEAARHIRLEGKVVLRAVIDERGDVADVEVVQGLQMGCSAAAADAVRSWKYRPATVNDRPVRIQLDVTVTSRLAPA